MGSQADKMQRLDAMDDRGECYCDFFGGEFMCERHSKAFHEEYARMVRENVPWWPGGLKAVIERVRREA